MEEFIKNERRRGDGSSTKEERVDAIFKWNEAMREEERAERKRRWVVRGGQKSAERKATRKMRKQRRDTERLRKMVLEPGPNQFIPSDVETA